MVAVPLFYIVAKLAGRRLRPLAAELQHEHASAIAIAEENLGMLPAIKTFTREEHESARFRAQVDRILHLTRRQLRVQSALGPALQFVAATGIVALLWFGGARVLDGQMSPADLVSFLLYAMLLARPVASLADVYGRTQTDARRARPTPRRARRAPGATPHVGAVLPTGEGRAGASSTCRSATRAARSRSTMSTCSVAAGETIAIVGPNGAGKSTLAHLLMRLHARKRDHRHRRSRHRRGVARQPAPPDRRRAAARAAVQRQRARQHRLRPAASHARRIEAAARLARAHDFIVELPQGYDTLVGDRGVRLSGGQQQRLALARALLKDPPILILDEATAMFDPQGEIEFLEGARDALRGRTVLLITHRPASLAVAERIVRMEGGRVVTCAEAIVK